jgi:serine/threonine protein phosphatase PrpC
VEAADKTTETTFEEPIPASSETKTPSETVDSSKTPSGTVPSDVAGASSTSAGGDAGNAAGDEGIYLPEEEYEPHAPTAAITARSDSKAPTLELPPYKPGEVPPPAEVVKPVAPDMVTGEHIQLERDAYAVTGRDSFGRVMARNPEGQEVMIVSYRGGSDLTRALYPHPMLPALLDAGTDSYGSTVIAHPKPEGRTLEAVMQARDLDAATGAMVDLARFNRYLVARSFALVSLEPREVLLSPTRFSKLPAVRRVGENAPAEAPRYGAPERVAGRPVQGNEGAFALGALLYHALVGQPIPEGELPNQFPQQPGVPQALAALLAPLPGRASPGETLELMVKLADSLSRRKRWRVAGASSVGLNPDRTTNEDACGWRLEAALGHVGQERRVIACVADGMGGMARGEIASTAAVERFLETRLEPGAMLSLEQVRDRVIEANKRVIEVLEAKAGGCTFTGLMADGPSVMIGHVGDTRAYIVRSAPSETDAEPRVAQLTEDHSMVAMLVKMGVIDAAAAHGHPDANKVTRALGSNRDLPPEYVFTLALQVVSGDHIVLVSDGVWGGLSPEDFERVLLGPLGVQDMADTLVREALKAGSTDNATAVVLEYEEREPI